MENKPFIIGITGNIASGKSVVRQYLENMGAVTIDADLLAHRTYLKGKAAYQPIIDTFGAGILTPDAQIDRKILGNIVFQDPSALKKLEAIVHPLVTKMISALVISAKSRLIVIEAIKLIEAGMANDCDQVWVVAADDALRLQRLVDERHLSFTEAKQRIESQPPQAEKISQAQQVIYTNESFKDTYNQVNAALKSLQLPISNLDELCRPGTDTFIRPLQVWDETDWHEFQLKLSAKPKYNPDIYECLAKRSVMGFWQSQALNKVITWKMENLLAVILNFEKTSQAKETESDFIFQVWIEHTAWQHLCATILIEEKILNLANFDQTNYQKLDLHKGIHCSLPIRALLRKNDIPHEGVFYKPNQDYEFSFF